MRAWATRGIALVALAVPASLGAQEPASPADLEMLLAEADANNPEIVAARKGAEVAAARVPRAGALPDPRLGVGMMNVPVADPRFDGPMTAVTVGVSEMFPFPGKLALREEVARYRAEAATWDVERVRQKVAADVKTAYYELYFIDEALDVTGRNETLVADFAQLTATKYGVGTGAQPDVLRAQVERTRLEDQLVALRKRRTAAAARLNALLGRRTDAPLPEPNIPEPLQKAALAPAGETVRFASAALGTAASVPALPAAKELQELALLHNPLIQAQRRRIRAQEEAAALAGKGVLPDFHVSVDYGRRPGGGDVVSAMVSVPLPIFAGRKQNQEVLEEEAALARARAELQASVNDVNERIASLSADLDRSRTQLVLLGQGILPQARASLESSTASYRVGKVDFLSLLDSQVKLFRHELDYHRLLSDFAKAVAALERAVGKEIIE